MTEQWRPIPGWEGLYDVSDVGRVRSCSRVVVGRNGRPLTVNQRILTGTVNEHGYVRVSLCRGNARFTRGVHQLVLLAFAGPAPDGHEACHNNGDPGDNRLINLRWDTRSSNMLDRTTHGTNRNAVKTECDSGHRFTLENTYYPPGKRRRQCRACVRTRSREAARARRQLARGAVA